jgi:aryl-alcohol dehydrogenase-like predicted oxidoreductase
MILQNKKLTFYSNIKIGVDGCGKLQNEYILEHDKEIIRRVQELANKHNVSTSTLALAWVLNKPYITSPLVGASKIDYVKRLLQHWISSLLMKR